ncbi:MAG: hypothetical protein QGH94_12170 [Phycisphaerae bacterium]|jgi:cell division protein FtsL|nr:hypothetical protein [Phycisphaerae bacterium]MDP7288738.1 hypothetical protein [Phycisphaerae bacterium]
MKRIPTINLILIAVIVMMVCVPMVFFRFRMMMANKVGLVLVLGLVILIGALARMGGEHKARRLAEEERLRQLTARNQNQNHKQIQNQKPGKRRK